MISQYYHSAPHYGTPTTNHKYAKMFLNKSGSNLLQPLTKN